jgi:hypothetical protein
MWGLNVKLIAKIENRLLNENKLLYIIEQKPRSVHPLHGETAKKIPLSVDDRRTDL